MYFPIIDLKIDFIVDHGSNVLGPISMLLTNNEKPGINIGSVCRLATEAVLA